jgi:drug/metabolite transporter (DMT)-like permease
VAFAANTVLCRLALHDGSIDAASFSTIRLASGALTLWAIVVLFQRRSNPGAARGDWSSAFLLFLYALPFSFAYLSLTTGTGALILFGAVQATMIASGLHAGERPHVMEWVGLVIAIGGLIYLVSPGLAAPSPPSAALMVVAGIAWGAYSLRGRGAVDPVRTTAGNFARSVPLALAVSLVALPLAHVSAKGALWAVLSGALASGVGYAIWYAALPALTATRAATVQLSVPVLSAVAGVILLGEAVTLRLVIAAVLILGGVGFALRARAA